MNCDVFLCHNSKDKVAVREIHEVLRHQRGFTVFLDESALIGGESWEEHIAGALAGSQAAIVMIGRHGFGDYQLAHEIVPALARRSIDSTFRIIPVLLQGFDEKMLVERPDVEELFKQEMRVDLREDSFDTCIKLLAGAIRGENAFPEGRPGLRLSRVRFDADRWEASGRNSSLFYGGVALREAVALLDAQGTDVAAITREFVACAREQQEEFIGRQLASHANALMSDPQQVELAVALAREAVEHRSTPEALDVLRTAFTKLPRPIVDVPLPSALVSIASGNDEIVFGCAGGEVVVWTEAGAKLLSKKHAGGVTALLFDPRQRWFASGGADGGIHVWQAGTHDVLASLAVGELVAELHAQAAAGGDWLLARGGAPGSRGAVKLWHVGSWEDAWGGHLPTATGVATLAADGIVLLAAGTRLEFASAEHGTLTVQHLQQPIFALGAHPHASMFALVTGDGQLWHGRMKGAEYEMGPLAQGISQAGGIRFSAGGRWLAACGRDAVRLFDLRNGGAPLLFPYEGLFDIEPIFSRDERLFGVRSGEFGALTLWDLHTRAQLYAGTVREGSPVGFVGDCRFAHAVDSSTVRIFEPPRQSPAQWTLNPYFVTWIRFSADERCLAWHGRRVFAGPMQSGDPGLFGLCEVETGRLVPDGEEVSALPLDCSLTPDEVSAVHADLLLHPSIAKACAARGLLKAVASPSRRWLALAHDRHLASLWDMERGQMVFDLAGRGDVQIIVFDQTESRVAFGDSRGGVAVWSTSGSDHTRVRHADAIGRIAFSPRGTWLAVSSVDGSLCLWMIDPHALAERVSTLTQRLMTDADWNACFPSIPRGSHPDLARTP